MSNLPVQSLVTPKVEAPYKTIVSLVEQNKLSEAIEVILEVDDLTSQIALLSSIATYLVRDLERKSEFARAYHYAVDLDFLLTNSLERATSLSSAESLSRPTVPNTPLEGTLVYDEEFTYAGEVANNLASDLDLITDSYRKKRRPNIDVKLVRAFLTVLEASLANIIDTGIDVVKQSAGNRYSIALVGPENITVKLLRAEILPFLEALVDIQRTVSHVKGLRFTEPTFPSIIKVNPINVDTQGLGEAIDAVDKSISPRRRRRREEKEEQQLRQEEAVTALIQTRVQKELIDAEVMSQNPDLQERMFHAQVRKMEAEARRAEAEALRTEFEAQHYNLQLNLEITSEAIEIAREIIHDLNVPMDERQLLAYALEIRSSVTKILTSPLDMIKPPPPSTLPPN